VLRLVSAIVVPAVIVSITATIAQRVGAAARLDPKRLTKQVSASVAATYPDLPVTKAVCPGRSSTADPTRTSYARPGCRSPAPSGSPTGR
jgi:hypothetical protein